MTGITVAGTIIASSQGVSNDKAEGVVVICHDYVGIDKFITGGFRPNKKGSHLYVAAIRDFKTKFPNVNIFFKKIKGHSGNRWNNMADNLAKGVEPALYTNKGLPMFKY
jgi:ribonuclease HI